MIGFSNGRGEIGEMKGTHGWRRADAGRPRKVPLGPAPFAESDQALARLSKLLAAGAELFAEIARDVEIVRTGLAPALPLFPPAKPEPPEPPANPDTGDPEPPGASNYDAWGGEA